ncbi:MAG: hypothetical protein ACOYKC_09035 [Anaerolineaceae bacterium]|jgi:hypothetical protein
MKQIKAILLTLFLLSGCLSCSQSEVHNRFLEVDVEENEKCMPLLLPSGIIPYEDNFLPDIVDEELSPLGWHRVTQLPDDVIVHERSRFFNASIEGQNRLLFYSATHNALIFDTSTFKWETGGGFPNGTLAQNTGNQLVVYEPIIADESLRLWRFNGEHNVFEEFSIKQDIGLERIEYIASNGQIFWGAFRDGEDKLIIGSFELDDKELNVGNFFPFFDGTTPPTSPDRNFYSTRIALLVAPSGGAFISLHYDNGSSGLVYSLERDGSYQWLLNLPDRRSNYYYNSSWKADMLLDDKNRFWVMDYKWINMDSYEKSDSEYFDAYYREIYDMYQSPIFITDKTTGHNKFVWDTPSPMTYTSDGRIWYKSLRGLAWHQPETGEWCMFTTAESNIVKDNDGNLWLVYDNTLYMLPASETQAKKE